MKFVRYSMTILTSAVAVSCTPEHQGSPETQDRSLEQRVRDLEQLGSTNVPQISPDVAKRQYELDLAEIRRVGLIDQAEHDIRKHLGDVNVKAWTIGYFVNTNTVWCDVRYSMPDQEELLQKEFGYERRGTNWNLLWDNHPKP